MNVRKILFALTKNGSRFHYRRHFCAVPNLSWGLLEWEADLAVFTRSLWLWEVEIKVSATDWLKDAEKAKWHLMETPGVLTPRRFYYAAPQALALQWQDMRAPAWAGIIGISEDEQGRLSCVELKPAADRDGARKATAEEAMKAARLGSMRFWTENHKALKRQEWEEKRIT